MLVFVTLPCICMECVLICKKNLSIFDIEIRNYISNYRYGYAGLICKLILTLCLNNIKS